jgi:hypothetical protein
MHPNKQRVLDIYGHEPKDLDDLAHCVISVVNESLKSKSKVVGLAWDISYSRTVSNTHHCPLDGKTNWGGRDRNLPRNYPGWTGRLWIRYATRTRSFESDPLSLTLTHTGSGGFGAYDGPWGTLCAKWYRNPKKKSLPEPDVYSWYYKIFEDDWPLVMQDLKSQMVLNMLVQDDYGDLHHEFLWEDPETAAKDREILSYGKDCRHVWKKEDVFIRTRWNPKLRCEICGEPQGVLQSL